MWRPVEPDDAGLRAFRAYAKRAAAEANLAGPHEGVFVIWARFEALVQRKVEPAPVVVDDEGPTGGVGDAIDRGIGEQEGEVLRDGQT